MDFGKESAAKTGFFQTAVLFLFFDRRIGGVAASWRRSSASHAVGFCSDRWRMKVETSDTERGGKLGKRGTSQNTLANAF